MMSYLDLLVMIICDNNYNVMQSEYEMSTIYGRTRLLFWTPNETNPKMKHSSTNQNMAEILSKYLALRML